MNILTAVKTIRSKAPAAKFWDFTMAFPLSIMAFNLIDGSRFGDGREPKSEQKWTFQVLSEGIQFASSHLGRGLAHQIQCLCCNAGTDILHSFPYLPF
jgi:hypothetical protein